MELGLDVTEKNGYAVLAVRGEVDVYTAPRLRERLVELVSQGKHQIVVDLEGVDFLDSTGLGVLVGGLKRLRSHDGDLTLVCTQHRILKVFEITGLTKVFSIHDSGRRRRRRLGPSWPPTRSSSSRSRPRRVRGAGPARRVVAGVGPAGSWPTTASTT